MTVDVWQTPPTVRRAYATGRYGQVHYRIVEPAAPRHPPFLVFHQTPTSGRCYEGLIAEMGHGRITVAVDTPGFGSSDAPAQAPTIGDYAQVMGALADSLGFARVDVLGDHTGAKIAVETALQHPDLVRRVVLNAALVYSDEELDALKLQDTAVETFGEAGEHILARWTLAMRQRAPDTPLEAVTLEIAEALRAGANVWHGHHAAFGYQHRENLPKVAQPVLVLHARDDLWTPTARARDLISRGQMIDLPQWGREMLLLRYREIAAILREFLDGEVP